MRPFYFVIFTHITERMDQIELKKYLIKKCCGSVATIYTTNKPLADQFIEHLKGLGFIIDEAFYKSGLIYATSEKIILSAALGTNRITFKTRKKDTAEQDILDLKVKLELLE